MLHSKEIYFLSNRRPHFWTGNPEKISPEEKKNTVTESVLCVSLRDAYTLSGA